MTTIGALSHHLERTVVIQARREIVFGFFTEPARWAQWWGAGSTIDAQPGGRVVIRYPDATEARGEVTEIVVPERIAFTYGYASGHPIRLGGSHVTIRLEAESSSTRLHLTHAFDDAAVRDQHVQGWRYQLSLFANVVANEVYAGAGAIVDAWFGAWSERDAAVREATLVRVAAPVVRFRGRFSLVDGIADLIVHLDAAQRFMPGIRLQREGDLRHCQGVVLADWVARAADGGERARGASVFILDPCGHIESVTGFWDQHPNR
jgi:uncharacterized protein YndB with AHSA1/START domain